MNTTELRKWYTLHTHARQAVEFHRRGYTFVVCNEPREALLFAVREALLFAIYGHNYSSVFPRSSSTEAVSRLGAHVSGNAGAT